MKKLFLLIGSALIVSACGGNGADSTAGGTTPVDPVASPTPTPAPADSFVGAIMALIEGTPENAEPIAVDAITVTQPEDTEPQPLG